MQVFYGTEAIAPEWGNSVVCIGTFDGLHLGHQAVLRVATSRSQLRELPNCVITFDRHPLLTLAPEKAPLALCSLDAKLELMAACGIQHALIVPFDAALSQTSASDFLSGLLIGRLRASEIVIGHDFAFGKGREGNAEWLAKRLPTTVVPAFEKDGSRVSSSTIRKLIESGEMEFANRLLGRNYCLEGVVVGGEKLGRKLGYPTANLAQAFKQVQPPDGVYVARTETQFGVFATALSIGDRPTVNGKARLVEAFLIDFPAADLYGQTIRIEILNRLRGQIAFDSLPDLQIQMAADVVAVRAYGAGGVK